MKPLVISCESSKSYSTRRIIRQLHGVAAEWPEDLILSIFRRPRDKTTYVEILSRGSWAVLLLSSMFLFSVVQNVAGVVMSPEITYVNSFALSGDKVGESFFKHCLFVHLAEVSFGTKTISLYGLRQNCHQNTVCHSLQVQYISLIRFYRQDSGFVVGVSDL